MTRWLLKHHVHGSEPRAVQVEAMRRSDGRPKFGQWLEQRLGKTSLDLNEFLLSDCDVQVVVAPSTFKMDWKLAPAEWGAPEVKSGMWPRDPLPFNCDKALYAINYEAARTGAYRHLEELFSKRRCKLTIDESSNIKNPNSETFRALIGLSKTARMVRELNGTPLTQNVMDFYPQLRCLGELDGVNPINFRNRYADMGGFMGRQVVGINEERQDELFAILERSTFRALRKDWLAGHREPERLQVHLEMTKRQQGHYDDMMTEFITMVDTLQVSAEIVLTQMEKAQQISSCLAMHGGEHRWIEEPTNNPKMQAVLDVHEAGAGKTIVVYKYKPSGAMLLEHFRKKKLQPAVIRGGMKPEDVTAEKRRFNESGDCRMLVGQIAATAMGHSLFGNENDRCDRMVFYENSFNLRDRLQIQDRNYYDYAERGIWDLIVSPMDQIVVDALSSKKNLADAVDAIVTVVKGNRRTR